MLQLLIMLGGILLVGIARTWAIRSALEDVKPLAAALFATAGSVTLVAGFVSLSSYMVSHSDGLWLGLDPTGFSVIGGFSFIMGAASAIVVAAIMVVRQMRGASR